MDLLPHLHEQGIDQLLKRALNGETVTSPDIQFYSTSTDQKGWVVGTYAPHRNARGEIIGVIATLQDITERKRMEKALRDSENKFATIIEFLPDATFVIDLEGKVVAWNRAMEEMTGVSKDDMIGQGDHAYTVPFYGERRQQLLDLLDKDDKEIASKYQYVQRKGDTLYAETFAPALHGGKGAYVWATGGPIFDVHGNRAGAIESIRDITERKRSEEELRWNAALLTAQVESSLDGILVVDGQGKRVVANQRLLTMWNVPQSIIDQENDEALLEYVAGRVNKPDQFLEKVMYLYRHQDETSRDEIEFKDGLIMDRYSSPVIGRDGKYYGRIWTFRDITDRKKAEEELLQNRDHLEERVRERTTEMERFIYTVSHDLRSPLVTVSGFVGLLKGDLESGDSQRAFSDLVTISESITKMDCLLVDTLELSRIGRVANPPVDVSFDEIVQEAIRQTEERIKSLDVAVYVAGDMPKVRVDVLRIAEVLVNLIENSVKYMGDQERPEIDIGSRKYGEETVFFVKDNGIGINPKEHEKVFGLFYKVDRKSEGTGVGLAIVKRIIEVHGGRIWIESELGKGCTVCFTLPLADYQ